MRIDYKTWGLIILGLFIAALVIMRDPGGNWPIREGLDIAGGVRVVMELQPTPGVNLDADTQKQVIDVLERRVNSLGVSEPVIQPKGLNQVIVELAESNQEKGKPLDKNAALETLRKAAKLEFVYLKDVVSDKNPFGQYKYDGSSFKDLKTGKFLTDAEVQKEILYKDPKYIIITGKNIKAGSARADFGAQSQGSVVTFELDNDGKEKFGDFTRDHVKDLMAVVYDGKVQSAPVIDEEISTGQVQIRLGSSPLQEAVSMADLLNAGALPVPLKVAQIKEVEASLGRDSVTATEKAGIVGLGAVCLFMAAYYLLPGILADLALIFYALLTFAIFRLMGVVMTLAGIAGFVLSIGMAVDANILIFERMKEELRNGKTLHSAIDAGFLRAFPSIRDSNLSTLITCTILWMYGTGGIRGFALVLGLGVVVSFFTAVTVTRTLLHLVVNANVTAHPSWFGVTRSWMNRAGQHRLDVVKYRNWFFGLSLALIIPGIIFLFMGGLKPGIDFTGGSMILYRFQNNVQTEDIRKTVQSVGLKDVLVQISKGEKGQEDAYIRTVELTPEQRVSVKNALTAKFPKSFEESYDETGPSISKELVANAFKTVCLASVLILLFLAYQFQTQGLVTGIKYGACAVIALIHDVFVLLGIFAIMGYIRNWEVDSLFVTAMLTVIGFSVHDTIVIFDRIRENWKNRTKDAQFGDVINASVNQTLSRSINTSFTVVLTLVALFVFGGSVLKLFIAALLFGIVSGTYSSIFNASPLLWLWERKVVGAKTGASSAPVRRIATPAPSSSSRTAPSRPATTPKASEPSSEDSGEATEDAPRIANGAPRPTARPNASRAQVRPKRKKRF